MGDILFLAHRIPYPPNKGDKIRSWHIFDHLRHQARIHLGCFVDDPHDMDYRVFLQNYCGESCFLPLNRRWATLKSAVGLLTAEALSNRFYASSRLQNWVDAVIQRNEIETIFIYSSTMAQFALPYADRCRLIMDFVDVDSEKWRQYAQQKSWPMCQVYNREAKVLAKFETATALKVDASLFVSEAEANLFRSHNPHVPGISAVSNGVDIDGFNPERVEASDLGLGPHIVFTGAMDYWANADAICWFHAECWPFIHKQYPHARLHIVGSNPLAEVMRLNGRDGTSVTGRVADVKPYIKAADVAIAPMRIARGIQNKILEAMALGRPVVSTHSGAEGIEASGGQHLLVADAPVEFAKAIIKLISDKQLAQQIGAAGREFICQNYSWKARLSALDSIVSPCVSEPDALEKTGCS